MESVRDGAGRGGGVKASVGARALVALCAALLGSMDARAVAPSTDARAVAPSADPWGRPTHLRAAGAPAVRWDELSAAARPVRLFWDDAGRGAEVQLWRRGRWRTVARAAHPGWTSAPVPRDARLRVRLDGATRWSPPVQAPAWTTPGELARLGLGGAALLGADVGELARDRLTGTTWASTLGGGLAEVGRDGRLRGVVGRYEGLPHERVVAVAADAGRTLVGTAGGAALLESGVVVQVWDAVLPDAYVQAVALEGPRLWAGTWRGLVALGADGSAAAAPAPEGAVYSLTPDRAGGLWVGTLGLDRVDATGARPDGATVDPLPVAGERVYDALDLGASGLLVATLEGGPQAVAAGSGVARPLPAYFADSAYALARTGHGLWVAAGAAGLFGPGGAPVGAGQGLDAGAVWSVVADPADQLLVGSDRGLWRLQLTPPQPAGSSDDRRGAPVAPVRSVSRLPLSPWPAQTAAAALWLHPKGAFLGGPEGVRAIGRPHPSAADLVVGAPRDVVAFVEGPTGLWAIGQRAVHLSQGGALDQVHLPERPTDALRHRDALWFTSDAGLWRLSPETRQAERVASLPSATRLAAGPHGVWVLSAGVVYRVVGGVSRPYMRARPALDLAVAPDGVWLGTEDGLERLVLGGDDPGAALDVLGEADAGVRISAVAADGAGGCWFAGADGSVGRVLGDGRVVVAHLPGPDPAEPTAVVPDGDAAWVLTPVGTWRVDLPASSARSVASP